MNALAYCTPGPVEIMLSSGGSQKIEAHRYGLLAVHQLPGSNLWSMTHLPTGLSFAQGAGLFTRAESACGAMVEISALKNDWLHLTPEDIATLSQPVYEIGRRHGGFVHQVGDVRPPDTTLNPEICRVFE